VLILKQYAYRGTDLVVIPQPDGTVACIPAWMTRVRPHSLSRASSPTFPSTSYALSALRPTRFYALSDPTQEWRKPNMKRNAARRQRDLFEADEGQTAPTQVQWERLEGLAEASRRR
jgi:hypothetical protein